MSPLDNGPLSDLSAEAPTGGNLELDPDFGALERAVQGRPEAQYGETRIAAVPPDWREAETLAVALLERTRDLRVLVHLAGARLHLTGLPGFAGVLVQIRGLLETRWEQVHPQLDPEDGLDPTLRCNVVLGLKDPATILRALRDLPLVGSARTGTICWRDIAVLHGVIEPDIGREKVSEAAIRAAFGDTDLAACKAIQEAAEQAAADAHGIQAAFEARAPSASAPDLTPLSKLLLDMLKELRRFEPAPSVADPVTVAVSSPETVEDKQPPSPTASPSRAAPARVRAIAEISSRDDALYLLDLATAYFRKHEPSSPLPLLLDRASRLAMMEFMDILRDLAPDGVGQAQLIAGHRTEGTAKGEV
jgi:type VI secretion system protein ImpA